MAIYPRLIAAPGLLWIAASLSGQTIVSGRITDLQNRMVEGALVRLSDTHGGQLVQLRSDVFGQFEVKVAAPGEYVLTCAQTGFSPVSKQIDVSGQNVTANVQFTGIAGQHQALVVSDKVLEPGVDLRNSEVFNKTLFTRDDQVLQQLDAGINAGQHEGGGKSLEIRRFGFNLDHGGVNGGLKVLVDDVQQNQGTQGHGQGYLGALKALSPELIQDVTIINGPFSAEYRRLQRSRRRPHSPAGVAARRVHRPASGRKLRYRPRILGLQSRRSEAWTPMSLTKAHTRTGRFRIPAAIAGTT